MPKGVEETDTPGPGGPPADGKGLSHDEGTAQGGEHLTRRQERNTALTEEAQRDPSGGAHSGKTDPTNP